MSDCKIFKNVKLGRNVTVEDYVIIGKPPKDKEDGELETLLGDNSVIRSHTVIYAGNKIGKNFQSGHGTMIRENNKIGDDVSVGTHSIVERDSIIEDGVRIHSNTFIPEYTTIKKNAWIGPGVIMTNAPHPTCPKAKDCMRGPTIGERARIGAGVVILPMIKIGKNSLIGAGAVVTKDVKPNTVMIEFPARELKKIKDLKCQFGLIKNPYEDD